MNEIDAFEQAAQHVASGGLHAAIGGDLKGFGGFLRCERCGSSRPLGNVGAKLATGWPKCCGYTMRWWTQRQIDNNEMPDLGGVGVGHGN